MTRSSRPGLVTAVAIGLSLAVTCPAVAHRDDYIDETFVYQTLARGEFELETWAELRSVRGPSAPNEGWYTLAFESGITNHWMVDGAAQAVSSKGHDPRFGRLRLETRCRFGEEGGGPVDVAVSAEYELETTAATGGSEAEHTLTPRLVLSKDLLKDVNTTLNLDFPIPLSGGRPAFAYAVGARYPAETAVRAGTELKGQPSAHTATLFPQIWFALSEKLTLKLGTGIGLTASTDPFLARVVFEAEF